MLQSIRNTVTVLATITCLALAPYGHARTGQYKLDTPKAHAFIHFKIQHLGFSWLLGRFNRFEGGFYLDEEQIENSRVEVTIDTASVDTNHAERDKHLRNEDFLHVSKFPKARFVSTKVERTGEDSARVTGDFTLHGVTRPVVLEVSHIGGGDDPWGGHRQGFEATTRLRLKDFGIDYDLGPASQYVEIYISAEGILQQ